MARWRDGFYYPGKIISMDEITKYQILFDDGDSMLVKVKDILLIEQLPIGQSVMVMSQDGYFDCGLIVEHVYQADKLMYKVECDNGSNKKCLRSEIILSEDQASCLMSDEELRITVSTPGHVIRKPAIVSLDNLIEGPRRSATKPKVQDKTDDVTHSTGKRKGLKKMRDLDGAEDDVPRSTERLTSKRGRSLKAASTPTPDRRKQLTVRETGRTPKKPAEKTPRKRKHPLDSRSSSPLGGAVQSPVSVRRSPRKGTVESSNPLMKIFAGMVFLLSHADKSLVQREQEKKLLEDSSLETSADENITDEEQLFGFDKEYLRMEIERRSGLVIDKYNKLKADGAIACYLISDTYQRTIKYIQCLAAGIPCVSHLWVRESCKQGKALDIKAYLLPAGISLQRRKLMEWRQDANCLEDYKVMVASTNTKFIDAWVETLTICRCRLFNRLPGPGAAEEMMLDVVVTDNTCPTNIKRRAEKLGIPVISTEWVIQCLINGHQVGYDMHPRYRHDFVEK
ncbi:TP53-binding protein 1-like [Gigantopelta aegis]|uniref:TP53-binding protein 1-like n=1 Tax=Gigantopelta aegis TaxID=1735272 RepID=UPI001B88A2B5|nr:TP53-binding protein 1-like [Gigantopelta aegis]